MDSGTTESSLTSALEKSDLRGLYDRFSSFLHPFSDFIPFEPASHQNKPKKKKKRESDSTQIRVLAKQFLPFLVKILKLIPDRISSIGADGNAAELFRIYRLSLDCLSCISPCLAGKPYSVHLQRVLFVRRLEFCGQYAEAENEGFLLLRSLREVISGNSASLKSQKGKKIGAYFLPDPPTAEDADPELVRLVMEIVVCILTCVSKDGRKGSERYSRILGLVGEAEPWLRVLDSKGGEKLHSALIGSLYRCTIFMAGEYTCFNGDLLHRFCMTAATECLKSSMKDQFPKLARGICSSLSSQWDGRSSLILDMLRQTTLYIFCECKVNTVCAVNEFLDFVYYCANNCRSENVALCRSAAILLKETTSDFLQVMPPVSSVLNIYAMALHFAENDIQTGCQEHVPEKAFSTITKLISNGTNLQQLASLLQLLASHFHKSGNSDGIFSSHKEKDLADISSLGPGSNVEIPNACKHVHGQVSKFSCLNALQFLCKPFAEHVNTAWRHIVSERGVVPFPSNIKYVQDAFHQFCDMFLIGFSSASDKERDKLHESHRTLFYVAIAAFRISLMTDGSSQESMGYINRVISTEWIQPLEREFLISSLYNIGASLYNIKQLQEASVALELCYRALWVRVSLVCQKFSDKAEGIHDDGLSEDAIIDIITNACVKSATFLDVLHQCHSPSINEVIVNSLLCWSGANNMLKKLSAPEALVKQWVKIMCKDFKNGNAADKCPSLHSLLSCSGTTWSKESLEIILEQELLSYAEMDAMNPNLCQRMQLKIIGILLQDIYVTEGHNLQRSRALVRKSRLVRACGIEGLKSCIQYLSEAISILNKVCSKSSSNSSSVRCQLALSYFLHALLTQEADQNSKVVLDDIHCALKLWSSLNTLGNWSLENLPELVVENAILLLCHVADLLSLKGYLNFHNDICKLIINLYKWKNVPLEKCLALLWGDRRLNHAICVSPICENFILNLSQEFNVHADSVDYWIRCIEGPSSSLLGFCQKFLLSDSILPQAGRYNIKRSLGCHFTDDKIKEAAEALISSVPVSSQSAFVAGHLYYDLCERLVSNGQLFKALSYAKEALRLRVKLLQRKFVYSFEQQARESVETVKQKTYDHICLEAVGPVITEVWPDIIKSRNVEGTILSPWNVLQCYLESTLQAGLIHEAIGNAAEAEALLLVGKKISCLQSLPLFIVSFSSLLGRIYCKKQLWDEAEDELNNAKQILIDSDATISCKQCKLTLEVTVDMQIGDLIRNRFYGSIGSSKFSDHSLELYRSAVEKLNRAKIGNAPSIGKETNTESTVLRETLVKNDTSNVNTDAKKSKKSKNTSKHLLQKQNLVADCHSRRSCTMSRSSRSKNSQVVCEVDSNFPEYTDQFNKLSCVVATSRKGQQLELNMCSAADFESEVIEAESMCNMVHFKWKCHWIRLLLRLFAKMGKCTEVHGKIHEVHDIFWQSISVLLSQTICQTYSDKLATLEFIAKVNEGDIFVAERAEMLYNISWLSVKNCCSVQPSIQCCEMSDIQISRVVSWLMQAFVCCRELPLLLKKISRLLAVIFLVSTISGSFSLPLYTGKALSVSHWAAYFHQASLGTYLHHQYLSNMRGKLKAHNSVASQVLHTTRTSDVLLEAFNSLSRFAPEEVEELEGFVCNFFKGLPCVTAICISLLGDGYGGLLGEILHSSFPAWMLLSRLDLNKQPIAMLLPVDLVHEDEQHNDVDYCLAPVSEAKDLNKKWTCPWGHTVVDNVAPQFKLILEENYMSTFTCSPIDTQRNRFIWWTRRTRLNERLDQFLRMMEDSWLGSWRCLLLGERSNCKHLDTVLTKLMGDLKRKCKFQPHESLLKTILDGAQSVAESETCVSQLLLYKGYLGSGGCCANEGVGPFSLSGVESVSGLPCQLILGAIGEFPENGIDREPVVLVLDADVQMLPWENLPILRKHEVYRMPSVASISAALNRRHHFQAQFGRLATTFPSVDPIDAYYLLNPSGDLSSTQVEFEEWFRNQNWKGKAGNIPTTEELSTALQNHDLFIYFGHGSGIQYIPGHEIQKLDNCAAALLMGCSSGSLSFMGCYAPQGAPISYLLAGSPAIISNLWDVTDKDIDRLARVMLDAWLLEASSKTCTKYSQMVEELRSLNIVENGGNRKAPKTRKAIRGKKSEESFSNGKCEDCGEKLRLASFMSQARDACRLPLLTGASTVCYGVPTTIRKKQP